MHAAINGDSTGSSYSYTCKKPCPALLKMGCLKTPLQGCSSTGPGVWVFNNNPRVSKGCEMLKVGCLKTLTEVFQGCGCLILKLCGGHYLE